MNMKKYVADKYSKKKKKVKIEGKPAKNNVAIKNAKNAYKKASGY